MITLFSIPKAFEGLTGVIQVNAIHSWLALREDCEIVLMGDDFGVADVAREFGVRHVGGVETNEFGTPLLHSAFSRVQEIAAHGTMMYINCDIIVFPDMVKTVRRVPFANFLLCGRRWDLSVQCSIDFSDIAWPEILKRRMYAEGKQHNPSGIDYFVFPRGSIELPPFAVGRPGWDGWLICNCRERMIPVIDGSEEISVLHQNHDYSHSKFGQADRVGGPELERNIKLVGGMHNLMTLRDADWVLSGKGVVRPPPARHLYAKLSMHPAWRWVLSLKRRLQY